MSVMLTLKLLVVLVNGADVVLVVTFVDIVALPTAPETKLEFAGADGNK